MCKGGSQRSVASHGNSADRTGTADLIDAVFVFDQRNKFPKQEIAVAHGAIRRIDVKRTSAFRSGDEKFSYLVLLAKIIQHRPSTAVEERALVVSQAVQKIKHRIFLDRLPRLGRVIAGREINAIMNGRL